jgi:hypothetical protein
MIERMIQKQKTALIAQVDFEEAYDSAKFALEEALPNASQETVNELLSSLIDVVLCSLKNQIVIGENNEPSSH